MDAKGGKNLQGVDCASKLNAATAAGIKKAGYAAVGRYLGATSWKGLTKDEVAAILGAGLGIFPIWETAPTSAGYFSYNKGVSDAQAAMAELAALGAPQGINVYFTVDYDAHPADFAAIYQYFQGVKHGLNGKYKLGAYGSFGVLTALAKMDWVVEAYFQTYAWSGGQVFAHNAIYQYKNGQNVAGVQVDLDKINSTAGLWVKPAPVVKEVKKVKKVIIAHSDADMSAALELMNFLRCPVILETYATPDLLAACTEKPVKVGGPADPKYIVLSGDDRTQTALAVANFIKNGGK